MVQRNGKCNRGGSVGDGVLAFIAFAFDLVGVLAHGGGEELVLREHIRFLYRFERVRHVGRGLGQCFDVATAASGWRGRGSRRLCSPGCRHQQQTASANIAGTSEPIARCGRRARLRLRPCNRRCTVVATRRNCASFGARLTLGTVVTSGWPQAAWLAQPQSASTQLPAHACCLRAA